MQLEFFHLDDQGMAGFKEWQKDKLIMSERQMSLQTTERNAYGKPIWIPMLVVRYVNKADAQPIFIPAKTKEPQGETDGNENPVPKTKPKKQ